GGLGVGFGVFVFGWLMVWVLWLWGVVVRGGVVLVLWVVGLWWGGGLGGVGGVCWWLYGCCVVVWFWCFVVGGWCCCGGWCWRFLIALAVVVVSPVGVWRSAMELLGRGE
ncbi:hypothetical protein, partial [Pseudomonas syringae group genomosp. 7]|uniref:hypothetical protein n=1 Tax=Pseudomonas syringae group genomosp. 7 TaxID=251699 RepID=UPI00376FA2E6